MGIPRVYIDGHLLNWGDSLFYPPIRRKNNATSNKHLSWVLVKMANKSSEIRSQIARTVNRTPEVMVKITSKHGAGRGMIAIGNHLDYISRNGKVALEDHEGRIFDGRSAIKDIKNDWNDYIPEVSNRREAINVIFSMAKGTSALDVKVAVREFLRDEFGGKHEYVFALHTDTDHPHVHVCIKMSPILKKYKRLNPRKKDLQRWREGFAGHLRKVGIAANATPRTTRGERAQPLRAKRFRDVNSGTIPKKFEIKAYEKQKIAWANIANVLSQSEDRNDRALAKDVVDFMAGQPIQITTTQVKEISYERTKHIRYKQTATPNNSNSMPNMSSLTLVQNKRRLK